MARIECQVGAELTSGAFFFHFDSKMDAFVEAVRVGLDDLKAGNSLSSREQAWALLAMFVVGAYWAPKSPESTVSID